MKTIAKLLLVLTLALAPSLAEAGKPVPHGPPRSTVVGVWEADDASTEFDVWLCGKDGRALCARLVAVRKGANNERNRPYLNKVIFEGPATSDKSWKGELHWQGYTAAGEVKFTGSKLQMNGCVLMVVCDDFTLYPKK